MTVSRTGCHLPPFLKHPGLHKPPLPPTPYLPCVCVTFAPRNLPAFTPFLCQPSVPSPLSHACPSKLKVYESWQKYWHDEAPCGPGTGGPRGVASPPTICTIAVQLIKDEVTERIYSCCKWQRPKSDTPPRVSAKKGDNSSGFRNVGRPSTSDS